MPGSLVFSTAFGIREVEREEWNALAGDDDPFVEHEFLTALEESNSVGEASGWLPRPVLVRDAAGVLVGAVPLYFKTNSYGEFIFDWGWAGGAQRAGIPYYPKLVAAVPFTPVTGTRLLVRPDVDRRTVIPALLAGVRAAADELGASSVHFLFCTPEEANLLTGAGYHHRLSMQFHWTNRPDSPYRDFDDFLSDFRSRNRKQVRHERAIAEAQGLRLAVRSGPELTDVEWRALQTFYLSNAEKHDAITYLTPTFFALIRQRFAHRVVATFAYDDSVPVAGSLNFEKGRHLYGRYWGALVDKPMLHFDLCYYRLIERAIARGCTRFEAGAQGEHKLKRGLRPAFTHSAHWIRHPELDAAISRFVAAEADAVRAEVAAYETLAPYASGR